MPDLILEIGTEEIPAGFIPQATDELKARFGKALEDLNLDMENLVTYGTPRRLVLIVNGLPERQADREEEILGPPKAAAFKPDGTPTKAGLGFARAKGVRIEDLQIKATPKGDYICIRRTLAGKETRVLLSELLPKLILSIPFRKSMRWGSSALRFVRPIHWILALFDGKVVPFDLEEIAAGARSRGHRFLAPDDFEVKDIKGYLDGLERHFVMGDPEKRRRKIVRDMEKTLSAEGLSWLEDKALLEEVSYLVEYPFVVMGKFDESYLLLPREVLVTAMREHQRYFSVLNADGSLAPRFIAINNTFREGLATFASGHERVLRARLEDAKFFFQEDRKVSLEKRVDTLKEVVFHVKLGTSYEKVQRIVALSEFLSETLNAEVIETTKRAAYLCKADLVTEMVGEFPSLQGTIGSIYARLSGEPEEVSNAIFEHYMPRFSEDALPGQEPGAFVGMADRMDTIVGCFGNDLTPTGAADPFGLRRAALAIIRIILERNYRISLDTWIIRAADLLGGKIHVSGDVLLAAVRDFFAVRLRGYMQAKGIAYDSIEAVLDHAFDDIADSSKRIRVFHEFRQQENFASLMLSFKRVGNILEGQPKGEAISVNPDFLKEPAEKSLYEELMKIRDAYVVSMNAHNYPEALEMMSSLKPVVDRFFDEVLVMDPDLNLRNNRLAILSMIKRLFSMFADFSKISASLSQKN